MARNMAIFTVVVQVRSWRRKMVKSWLEEWLKWHGFITGLGDSDVCQSLCYGYLDLLIVVLFCILFLTLAADYVHDVFNVFIMVLNVVSCSGANLEVHQSDFIFNNSGSLIFTGALQLFNWEIILLISHYESQIFV